MQMSAAMLERLVDDRARVELGVLEQRARGRLRVRAARADREQLVLGLDHVAGARDQERLLLVGDDQERLEPAQHPIRAPILRELDCGARAGCRACRACLEVLEQRERVGGAACEARDHLAVMQASHLARVAFHHLVAERDLAVAAERDVAVAANAHDRRAVKVSWSWRLT